MNETSKTDTEWGTRVRAGLVLTRSTVEELATQLGISSKTLLRSMRGERTLRPHEPTEIATLLNLPESFFDPEVSAEAAVTSSQTVAVEILALIQDLRRTLDVREARLHEVIRRHSGDREAA